ncbi:MAG TPA: 3-deoxy-D-manno-octulosonic acid transferase [Pseudorhodoplanes sp.]|nr:3-deoxy-D-manno-octulosonic acid transferase [Pseudorhodoplanes sp.]
MSAARPLSLRLYRMLTQAARPLAGLFLARRRRQGKEHATRIPERYGETEIPRPSGSLIWLHGASVGELASIFPLVEKLRQAGLYILVTSGTVTSAALARERLAGQAIHQFIPLDIPRFVNRFLSHWKPDLALFVESDLWPNLVQGCRERRIPMIIVNGRLSERSFMRWKVLPSAAEALLRPFDLCLAQSRLDGDRFAALGARRVEVCGNLKLDVPAPPVNEEKLQELKNAVGSRPVIAAASTHPGEEAIMLDVHRRLRQAFPALLTMIVPRHVQRGRGICDLIEKFGLAPMLRSQRQVPVPDTDVYVADTMGELGLVYRLSPIVFMGGSLIEHGGQNPIEAVKLGAAVVHGPHVWNFAEIYAALDAARGAAAVEDPEQLVMQIGGWLSDAAAREAVVQAGLKTVNRLGGALERTLAQLEPYLLQLRINLRPGDA